MWAWSTVIAACAGLTTASGRANAQAIPFSTSISGQYLLISLDRSPGNQDINVNSYELGAMKCPVACTDDFLNNRSTGGPTLRGAVPNLPGNAKPLFQGVVGRGNIAVTDRLASFHLQDVGVYASPAVGIRVAGSSQALNQSSNSFFNDPELFPNTFKIDTQTGDLVNPNDADQTTRIDPTTNGGFNRGVTYGVNHADLLAELAAARASISGLPRTGTLGTGGTGKISNDRTITLSPGLNVIDINTGGNDFLIENCNLVIDGPEGSAAIFRIPARNNMLISNSNVVIGRGGISENSVVFFTAQAENDTHFNFNNTIINGVAFWSLGPSGGSITINNAQGCTQLIADIIDLDDVRFNGCQFTRSCPADFNDDGFVDFFDYSDFVECFDGGACPPGKTADYNGDGFIDFFDFKFFVRGFEAGC